MNMRGKLRNVVITLFVVCMSILMLQKNVVKAETLTEGDYKYEILEDGTVMITDYTGNATELTIPNTLGGRTVTVLGDKSFMECTTLTSVIIPEGVKWIGEGTSYNGVFGAFYECSSLKSVSIPSSVTHIRRDAFLRCNKLENVVIPEGVTNIEWSAFHGCEALTKIELPATLSVFEQDVFGNCPNLTELIVDANNSTYYSEGNCVIESATKNLIQGCSASTIPEDVTGIGWNAFYGCVGLENIVIPNSVTTIQPQAFSKCADLKSIKISNNVTTIKYSTFWDCSSLVSVELPEGLTSMEDLVFRNCSSLKNIKIPESVTSIGAGTFFNCSALEQINIPKGVTEIGKNAFYNCCSLKEVTIPSSVIKIDSSAFKYEVFNEISCVSTIYDINATYYVSAGSYAETWAKNNDLTIEYIAGQETKPEQPTTEAPTTEIPTEVPTTELPATEVSTEEPTTEAPTTEIPTEVPTTEVPTTEKPAEEVPEPESTKKITYKDNKYTLKLKSKTATYTGTKKSKSSSSITVPDIIRYGGKTYKVTAIDSKAFKNFKKLKTVTIGKNIKSIASDAFSGCKKIKYRKLSSGAKVSSFSVRNIKGKKAKATWKKESGISGYQIRYATNSKFSRVKTKSVSKSKTTYTMKLTKGKTYYFQIRSYKTLNKKKYYSSWSSTRKVKINK